MRIRFVILGAYGMGGTTRTVLTAANALAESDEVEVCSLLRTADEPYFDVSDRVRLVPLVDARPGARQGGLPLGPLRRRLAAMPSRDYPRADHRWRQTNRLADLRLKHYLRSVEDGAVVGTRPGLNMLVAQHVRPGVTKVGQAHMNTTAHRLRTRNAMRRHYGRLDALVALTPRDAAGYSELLKGTGARVVTIPNAVPATSQPPSSLENPVIVTAGRLTPRKGYDLLVKAFTFVAPMHPEWTLRIFGDGRERDRLEKLVHDAGLTGRVQLLNRTDRLDTELARASIFVLSSRAEGLPLVMLEAMRSGLPVVSFDCPTGPADVITDGKDGLLVPPENPEALGAALRTLVEDPGRRRSLAEAGLRTARRYSVPEVTKQWHELIRRWGS